MTSLMPTQLVDNFIDGTDDTRRHHQIELEKLYNKNQTISRIKREFVDCEEFDFAYYLGTKKIDETFGFDLLTQMALHKRTTLPTLAGILRHHFEPSADASQLCVDMIQLSVDAQLVKWDRIARQFIVQFEITAEVQADLDRYQYPLPMVIKPKTVRDNTDTGYFTSRGSLILRKNHHDNDICLDHINRVNRVRFAIDHNTARMVKNSWRNLDKPKPGESKEEFTKRVKAFDKYDRTAHEVMTTVLAHGNEFYLTHKYDKRGRIYCQGYHINYQGAPWNKAVVELADKELVQ